MNMSAFWQLISFPSVKGDHVVLAEWTTRPQDHRTTGPQGYRTTGPQDHRTTGPQDHRTTRPQDHRTIALDQGRVGFDTASTKGYLI